MNINAKSIEGLKMLSKGLDLFIEGLEESMKTTLEVTTVDTQEIPVVSDPVSEKIEDTHSDTPIHVETVEVKKSESVEEKQPVKKKGAITEEELSAMSYNDLKKYAKELGITAVGNRVEIVNKILAHNGNNDTEPENEPVKKFNGLAKIVKKEELDVPEIEEDSTDVELDEEPDEDEEDEVDPVTAQVNEAVEDMSDGEIRELLESVDISPKGKRQALIDKLIKAVHDGKIALDDEDNVEEEDSEENEDETSADVTDGMTSERKKTYKELCDDTNDAFENGDITREDLIDFINSFNGTNDKMKKVSDEDLLAQYLELSAMLVSDEGEIIEEGAYTVNDEPYCCGHPLSYNKKKKVYYCEICGTEYEADED